MFWLLWFLGALLALVLLAYAFGLFLPEEHEVSRSVVVNAAPDEVYALIAGPQTWRTKCEDAPANGTHRRWREYWGRHAILFEQIEAEPNQRVVTRIADENLPFAGTWTYELQPADGGTQVQITEHGRVKSPLFRTMALLMGQSKSIEGYLRALTDKIASNHPAIK